MGSPRKPADRRQGHKTRDIGILPAPGTITNLPTAPPPSKAWLVVTRNEWAALWEHPIALTYDRTLHEPVLRRLFDLRDERERCRRVVRKTPFIQGSQGQPVLNPLRTLMNQIDSELRQLEDRFGLNIQALLRVGIQFGEAKRSLDELAREIYDEDDPDDGDDPRLLPPGGGNG